MDAGEVTIACPAGGVRCVITVSPNVDEDGELTGTSTVTFVGGMAMATDSAAGKTKLAKANDPIVITGLPALYNTIPAGTYTIQPGENMDVGEANFVCPEGGIPCVVTVKVEVDADMPENAITTITTAGALATVRNSIAAMTTKAARDLSDTTDGALRLARQATAQPLTVTRTTDGATTTVALIPLAQ